jgi:hypothetical protein
VQRIQLRLEARRHRHQFAAIERRLREECECLNDANAGESSGKVDYSRSRRLFQVRLLAA